MESDFSVRAVTRGPRFHIKPYYDMQPWDASRRYFLCMESAFQDRAPTADDALTVGVVDLETTEFRPLAETHAWNFQQGCMPHWMPAEPECIVFNDRVDGAFRAVVQHVDSGERRVIQRPVQAVSPDGHYAASLNFSRWAEWRPGYGYAGIPDPHRGVSEPEHEAVHLLDLKTGQSRSLVWLKDVLSRTSDLDARKGSTAWFCHLMFNTDGSKLLGLVRWWAPHAADEAYHAHINIDGAVPERRHCMWVAETDGAGLEIVVADGLVSHAEWRDRDHVMAWANPSNDVPPAYRVFDVRKGSHETVGEQFLSEDGHMSYHPCRKQWLLTDTYPDENFMRRLKLYNIDEDREVLLGRFHAPPELQGELRCDLHPCWNRDGTQVAIDSIHEGGCRQVYIVDVGSVDTL